MKKIIKLLSSESLLCLLTTFFVCAFLPGWYGLVAMFLMLLCNLFYTKLLDTYKLAGFIFGWAFAVLQHWIY